MMLPDAIAAVVEAWYEAHNTETIVGKNKKEEKYYTVEELQKLLNRGRATIYRILNTSKEILNPPFDPYKLNYEYRCDTKDSIRVSSLELDRWRNNPKPKPIYVETKSEKTNEASCKQQVLDYVSRLINARLLTTGDKMPSLRDLANRIGFHRNSVLKAYVELEQEGAIIAKLGSGFYILDINRFIPANAI